MSKEYTREADENGDQVVGHVDRSITVTLPVPPPQVRPNGRPHWRAKAKAVKSMRCLAWAEALRSLFLARWYRWYRPHWTHASIRIDWYHPTKKYLDRDNIIASCKAYLDGIVDAGVLADDRDVTFEPVGRFKDSNTPRVEIAITPTGGSSA